MKENWEKLMEEKYFDIDEHLIWMTSKKLENLEIPDGYYEIKLETIKVGKRTYYKKYLLNNVPVIANLYYNTKTKEISYYFAGSQVVTDKHIKTK